MHLLLHLQGPFRLNPIYTCPLAFHHPQVAKKLRKQNRGKGLSHHPTPPSCATTLLLSGISTLRLRSALSSGLITFSSFFPSPSAFLAIPASAPVAPALEPCFAGAAAFPVKLNFGLGVLSVAANGVDASALDDPAGPFRWRTVLGGGKLCFRSIVSTVRWKRRKSACARRRVEGRSMVDERSLTEASSQPISAH